MSIDVNKLIDGLGQAAPPRAHPVDAILDDLVDESEEAYERLLWMLRNPKVASAPSISNALSAAGAGVRPSQINSWRRREGIRMDGGEA